MDGSLVDDAKNLVPVSPTPDQPPITGDLLSADIASHEKKLAHDLHMIRGKALSIAKEESDTVQDAIKLMIKDAADPERTMDQRMKALRCITEVTESGMKDIVALSRGNKGGIGEVIAPLTDEECDDMLEE